VFALTAALAAQSDKTVTTTTISVNETDFDVCTNEYVQYSGDMTLDITSFTDGNGAFHFLSHQKQMNVIGTGLTSGLDYRIQSAGSDVEVSHVLTDSAQVAETAIIRSKMTGLGALPNEQIQVVIHETRNADGTVTAVKVEPFESKCTGASH
jgi:hypothetical protein